MTSNPRLDLKEETKLAVDAEEQRAVLERLRSNSDASTPPYHFICEAFFLTARGLHLGLVKMIQDLYNIARVGPLPASPEHRIFFGVQTALFFREFPTLHCVK